MNEQLLKRSLQSVGMEYFAKYYEQFSNTNIEPSTIIDDLVRIEGYQETACQTRVSKARSIINAGLSHRALQVIVDSKKVSSAAKSKTSELLLHLK